MTTTSYSPATTTTGGRATTVVVVLGYGVVAAGVAATVARGSALAG